MIWFANRLHEHAIDAASPQKFVYDVARTLATYLVSNDDVNWDEELIAPLNDVKYDDVAEFKLEMDVLTLADVDCKFDNLLSTYWENAPIVSTIPPT